MSSPSSYRVAVMRNSITHSSSHLPLTSPLSLRDYLTRLRPARPHTYLYSRRDRQKWQNECRLLLIARMGQITLQGFDGRKPCVIYVRDSTGSGDAVMDIHLSATSSRHTELQFSRNFLGACRTGQKLSGSHNDDRTVNTTFQDTVFYLILLCISLDVSVQETCLFDVILMNR